MKKIFRLTIFIVVAFVSMFMIGINVKAVEVNDAPTEEIPEVEEEKGFIERNFEQLILTITTDTVAFTAFLGFIIKANNTTKGILKTISSQVEMSDGSAKKIQKLNDALDKSNAVLEKAIVDMKENNAKVTDVIGNFCQENKEEIEALHNQIYVLTKAVREMVNYNRELVANGHAERINQIIDGVDENEQPKQ